MLLNGQATQLMHAKAAAKTFSNQLQLPENSTQTMLNAVVLTQGQTQQILHSLQGGQQGWLVLLPTYLAILESQADGLANY